MKQPPEQTAQSTALQDTVSALFELMKQEKLEELELTDSDMHIRLKRKGRSVPAAAVPVAYATAPAVAPVADSAEQEKAEVLSGETVQSPIMGVLYRAPSPSSPPFVKEGDVVDAGKTLCIIEAMKVMNEIKADGRMKVLKILVENGKPITAGQDLFLIERA